MVVPVFLAAHKVSLVVALAVVFHFRGNKNPKRKTGSRVSCACVLGHFSHVQLFAIL